MHETISHYTRHNITILLIHYTNFQKQQHTKMWWLIFFSKWYLWFIIANFLKPKLIRKQYNQKIENNFARNKLTIIDHITNWKKVYWLKINKMNFKFGLSLEKGLTLIFKLSNLYYLLLYIISNFVFHS